MFTFRCVRSGSISLRRAMKSQAISCSRMLTDRCVVAQAWVVAAGAPRVYSAMRMGDSLDGVVDPNFTLPENSMARLHLTGESRMHCRMVSCGVADGFLIGEGVWYVESSERHLLRAFGSDLVGGGRDMQSSSRGSVSWKRSMGEKSSKGVGRQNNSSDMSRE